MCRNSKTDEGRSKGLRICVTKCLIININKEQIYYHIYYIHNIITILRTYTLIIHIQLGREDSYKPCWLLI